MFQKFILLYWELSVLPDTSQFFQQDCNLLLIPEESGSKIDDFLLSFRRIYFLTELLADMMKNDFPSSLVIPVTALLSVTCKMLSLKDIDCKQHPSLDFATICVINPQIQLCALRLLQALIERFVEN